MKKTRNNTVKRIIASALSAVSVAAYSIPAGTGFSQKKFIQIVTAELSAVFDFLTLYVLRIDIKSA